MNYNFETLAQIEEAATFLKEQVDADQVAPDRLDQVLIVLEKLRDDWRELSARLKAAEGKVYKSAPKGDATEGMHRVGLRIFKVQKAVHGSGHLYAKELVKEGDRWVFEYAKGAMRMLSASTLMSLAEAKEFGALYGTCCVCGRTLTNETSIEEGIGPVCSGRFDR